MFQAIRGRNRKLGYFLRGATRLARERTIEAVMRFVMGIALTTYDRNVAGIHRAVADAPSQAALRGFVRSKSLSHTLPRLLDWKTRQNIAKALRRPRNRDGSIILAIDSTFKSTRSRRARDLFRQGRGTRVGQHIFVCGLLVFPDHSRLPLRPRQKRRGKGKPTQCDLAVAMIHEAADLLGGRDVVVTADAFFFCKKVLRAIRDAGFHYVLACQGNTVLCDGTRLDTLAKGIRLTGSCAILPSSKGERPKRYSVARRALTLRCGGTQAVVFSRPHRTRRARMKYLVSDLMDTAVAEIVRLYALRWQIELFFRDAKVYLGLEDYRLSGPHAPENFAMRVVLTYQFLHWSGTAVGPPTGTLARVQALGDEVATDNVAAIVRAYLTRHGPKRLLDLLHRPRCAHGSRSPQTSRSPKQKTA